MIPLIPAANRQTLRSRAGEKLGAVTGDRVSCARGTTRGRRLHGRHDQLPSEKCGDGGGYKPQDEDRAAAPEVSPWRS